MAKGTQDYKPTESQNRGGAKEMYVTYDLAQETTGDGEALYPKVKRVYIAGEIKGWEVGTFKKRSGEEVHGVKINYEQSREGYERKGHKATRGRTRYPVTPAQVGRTKSSFTKIVEVPEDAQNVKFHTGKLPPQYQDALQDVR